MKELVIIEWEDAFSNDGYLINEPDIDDFMPVISVGWLVKETDKTITLAMSHHPDSHWAWKHYLVTPKKYIVKITRKKYKERKEVKDESK